MLCIKAAGVRPNERPPVAEQFVEEHTEGPDVGPFVCMLAVILLGRHVCESSDQHSGLSLRSLEHAGDPEIDDLHRAVFVHHNVAGLDIAVNDASFMGVVKRAARLRGIKKFQGDWSGMRWEIICSRFSPSINSMAM